MILSGHAGLALVTSLALILAAQAARSWQRPHHHPDANEPDPHEDGPDGPLNLEDGATVGLYLAHPARRLGTVTQAELAYLQTLLQVEKAGARSFFVDHDVLALLAERSVEAAVSPSAHPYRCAPPPATFVSLVAPHVGCDGVDIEWRRDVH